MENGDSWAPEAPDARIFLDLHTEKVAKTSFKKCDTNRDEKISYIEIRMGMCKVLKAFSCYLILLHLKQIMT